MIEDTATTSTSAVVVVSANQEATQVPEGMVIEKRVPDLLALLESYAGEATLEVPIVPRPSTPTPPPPSQIDLANKKKKRERKLERGLLKRGRSKKKLP